MAGNDGPGRSPFWVVIGWGFFVMVVLTFLALSGIYHFLCKPPIPGAILFNVLWVLAAWSYLRTVFTDPGTRRCKEWEAWRLKAAAEVNEAEKRGATGDTGRHSLAPNTTFCKKCDGARPMRAHHCSKCGTCILRMDHHCPWMGNCIGWRNHKYFLLFCFWSVAASVGLLATMRHPNALEAVSIGSTRLMSLQAGMVMISCILVIVMSVLLAVNLYMACSNQTMVEDQFRDGNPFDLGSSIANLRQLIGTDVWMLLPVPPSRPSSGTHFPVETKSLAGYGGYGGLC